MSQQNEPALNLDSLKSAQQERIISAYGKVPVEQKARMAEVLNFAAGQIPHLRNDQDKDGYIDAALQDLESYAQIVKKFQADQRRLENLDNFEKRVPSNKPSPELLFYRKVQYFQKRYKIVHAMLTNPQKTDLERAEMLTALDLLNQHTIDITKHSRVLIAEAVLQPFVVDLRLKMQDLQIPFECHHGIILNMSIDSPEHRALQISTLPKLAAKLKEVPIENQGRYITQALKDPQAYLDNTEQVHQKLTEEPKVIKSSAAPLSANPQSKTYQEVFPASKGWLAKDKKTLDAFKLQKIEFYNAALDPESAGNKLAELSNIAPGEIVRQINGIIDSRKNGVGKEAQETFNALVDSLKLNEPGKEDHLKMLRLSVGKTPEPHKGIEKFLHGAKKAFSSKSKWQDKVRSEGSVETALAK